MHIGIAVFYGIFFAELCCFVHFRLLSDSIHHNILKLQGQAFPLQSCLLFLSIIFRQSFQKLEDGRMLKNLLENRHVIIYKYVVQLFASTSIGSDMWPECFYRTPRKLRLLRKYMSRGSRTSVCFSQEDPGGSACFFMEEHRFEGTGREDPERRHCPSRTYS